MRRQHVTWSTPRDLEQIIVASLIMFHLVTVPPDFRFGAQVCSLFSSFSVLTLYSFETNNSPNLYQEWTISKSTKQQRQVKAQTRSRPFKKSLDSQTPLST